MSVAHVTVSELAEQIRGVTYDKADASAVQLPGYLPVLRAGNIGPDGLRFDDLVFVPAHKISGKQLLRRHDVVIAASSGSLDVVGKAASLLSEYTGGFGAFCKVLRPGPRVEPRYFAQFFKTSSYRRRVSRLAAGNNINNLRNEHLDDLQIPLPPLSEQRRIAEVLDRAEALRAKRRTALFQLDNLVQSIFLNMFGEPVSNPMGWSDPKLGALLTFQQYGPRFYNESYSPDGTRIVRITDLSESGDLNFGDMPRLAVSIADQSKYALQPGDIIFARTGATVGKVALIRDEDPPCIAGAYFITMRFVPELDPLYVRSVLTSPAIREVVARRSRQAAQQNFSGPALRQLPMPVPPRALQDRFAGQVASVDTWKASHRASLTHLDALFASLQHRAFRGEL